ncbi:hypothetical protein AALO_G00266690 [Alosa alosa]|uniref:Uncharacterized protein n=1 Tax=Alosa alosa TaxID=278164 RepID=A0AAV6FL79_9TELE|nr:hypothetical protein AALO_G00266690 [Alosa alosa]
MVNILSAKDIPLSLYLFLQLHHLAEFQAAESLPLNLEKTVKHLTMGQDRNTLHHLNSLHLHLHLTYAPSLNVQRTEELCAVRKNMVTRFQPAVDRATRRCVPPPSTQME